MPRSFALWLHLRTRANGKSVQHALPAQAVERPEGPLLWLQIATPESANAALHLIHTILRLRPDLNILVSGAPDAMVLPEGVLRQSGPVETVSAARAMVSAWDPALFVLLGAPAPNALPAALISEASAQGAALALLEARPPQLGGLRTFSRLWWRAIARAVYARFDIAISPDKASAVWLERMGISTAAITVSGPIREPVEPLSCTEAERAALAQQLQSRPLWFAVAVPEAEEDAVLAAHEKALLRAHRMLLVLMPDGPGRAERIAAEIESRGHRAAWRAVEEEPEDDVQVLIVEDERELGLWYRLAPLTWMGGTLYAGGAARSPLEAAALGSAVVHGPVTGQYADDYARLADAGACRLAVSPEALADVVAELIAPDRVAALAHNAWAMISGQAGAAEQVARRLLGEVDAALSRKERGKV